MIVRCPGCGAETELENSNSVQETECPACHQKLVVGQLERQSQSPNHSKCPLPLKGASVVYLLIGCVVAIVSTKVRVDFFGSFDWIGGFWSVVSCIALIAGSYCFLIGQRLGRAFFAMSVVLGVLSKHVFLSMWLCLPLVFSLGKSSRDWFACNGGWLHFLKATIGLRLWVKLLFGLYFFVFVWVMVMPGKLWLSFSPCVCVSCLTGRCYVIQGPCGDADKSTDLVVGINPDSRRIIIFRRSKDTAEEVLELDKDGFKKCKEYMKTNASANMARGVAGHIDAIRRYLGY